MLNILVIRMCSSLLPRGAVAQLGEHLLCKQGVRSSSLLSSTKPLLIETNNPCMEIMVKPKRSPELSLIHI